MALGPRLDLRQSQSLVMTPQLQQAIKLLALSNLELESVLGEALEANPLLERGENLPPDHDDRAEEPVPDARRTTLESSPVDALIGEGRASEDRPLDIDPAALDADRGTDDGTGFADRDGAAMSRRDGEDWPSIDDCAAAQISLTGHLEQQLRASAAAPKIAGIAGHIIGQLDEAGYLPLPLAAIAAEHDVCLADAEQALALVQSFDPTGVGARTLAECIALQAQEADRFDPAMALLVDNLELVARGDIARLRRLCEMDDEDLAEMLAELRRYDPKPGMRFGGDVATPVTPDILVTPRSDGGWNIAINQATLPQLIVNRRYYTELRMGCEDKSSKSWLADKLADANWLVKALDQRQKTILKVAGEIVRHQDSFFRHGASRLKPLTLRMIADAVALHESTISRATANKYLHCPRGTFELKYFFASGVAAARDDGAASAEAVKHAIRQLIDSESPGAILSDDALVELLRERGFDLARRTVAKYREAIGLGSSVQRRRQTALAGLRKGSTAAAAVR